MAETDEGRHDGSGALAALIARANEAVGSGKHGGAPVDRWNPPFCGDIDMEIRADGTWFYMGTPIGRPALVRLFSTVLRKDDDGDTFLVTPVEKLRIRVVDAPFLAVEMVATGSEEAPVLSFRTGTGDVVEANAEHPLRFVQSGEGGQLRPYILVRGRLEALVSRAVTYDLMERGEVLDIDGVPMFVIRSAGAVFPVMPMAELEAGTDE